MEAAVLQKEPLAVECLKKRFLAKEQCLIRKRNKQLKTLMHTLHNNGTCQTFLANPSFGNGSINAILTEIRKTDAAIRANRSIMEVILNPRGFGVCPKCNRHISIERLRLIMKLDIVEKLCNCSFEKH